ncbi:hypothetical protein AAFO92_06390 [Roseovarius sp. CAU 1744]|uniref:hypothetical protein n=1 Tax=Roseovarius sp. CAU 1744 TaxID=3140368 RepID=UPI00325BFB42
MSANLLEKARDNRRIALEVLEQRESNLFVLSAARKNAIRRDKQVMFFSRRATASKFARAETRVA